eukprot:m.10434 g.10434  ORF g.10434 m.10434 type:complete len:102 (+) comp5562_c0_seq1:5858-6163(+)
MMGVVYTSQLFLQHQAKKLAQSCNLQLHPAVYCRGSHMDRAVNTMIDLVSDEKAVGEVRHFECEPIVKCGGLAHVLITKELVTSMQGWGLIIKQQTFRRKR